MSNFKNTNHLDNADDRDLETGFQSRFMDYEVADVPDIHWAAIEQALPRRRSWWQRYRYHTSVLLLLLLISTCYFGQKQSNNGVEKISIANTEMTQTATDNESEYTMSEAEKQRFLNARRLKNQSPYGIQHDSAMMSQELVLGLVNQAPSKTQMFVPSEKKASKNSIISEKNVSTIPSILEEMKTASPMMIENNNAVISDRKSIQPFAFLPLLAAENIAIAVPKHCLWGCTPPPKTAPPLQPVKRNPWAWIISVMPQYTYFDYEPIMTDHVILNHFQSDAAFSNNRQGLHLQIGVERQLSSAWHWEAGLSYQRLAKSIHFEHHRVRTDTFISTVTALEVVLTPVLQTQELHEQTNYDLIGARFGLGYQQHLSGKWSAIAQTNVAMNVLSNDWSKNAANVALSLGIARAITPNLTIRVSPTIQYFLDTKTFSSETLLAQPYTLGLNVGVVFR
jgi:hypothetical protein